MRNVATVVASKIDTADIHKLRAAAMLHATFVKYVHTYAAMCSMENYQPEGEGSMGKRN